MSADTVFIALGSNLGDREGTLRAALARMRLRGIAVQSLSSLYETEPQGFTDQPWFLNAVIRGQTELSPFALLQALRDIEGEFGRNRADDIIPNGPRTLDLDILLYGKETITSPELTIPHPRMLERRFVLEPLLEIAPDAQLPTGDIIAPYLEAVQFQKLQKR